MSNPLDSVTRTVNSLLTALKMPDASSEANDVPADALPAV